MLKIKKLYKKFTDKPVLEDFNLDIKKGEIISLLGQSGSGKSTVLNIIAGFEDADSGSMDYDEKVMFSDGYSCPAQNRNIGFVFQNYALFPHLNIEKNIAFGIDKERKSFQKEKVTSLLKLIKLEGIEKKYPHQLSGGQQQRVAIARVLARESKLILFDEVFSSIDTSMKFTLISQLKEILKSQNITAIFVTHDPKEAILLSDRIAYIENGKIIQYDVPKVLHLNPSTHSVANIFGKDSFLFKKIEELI